VRKHKNNNLLDSDSINCNCLSLSLSKRTHTHIYLYVAMCFNLALNTVFAAMLQWTWFWRIFYMNCMSWYQGCDKLPPTINTWPNCRQELSFQSWLMKGIMQFNKITSFVKNWWVINKFIIWPFSCKFRFYGDSMCFANKSWSLCVVGWFCLLAPHFLYSCRTFGLSWKVIEMEKTKLCNLSLLSFIVMKFNQRCLISEIWTLLTL
jgi:hypothetical protein